jgi:O-antigen ligase
MKKPAHKPAAAPLPTLDGERWAWVTAAAFVLAVGLACARGMMVEELRAPFEARPGVTGAPESAGPAVSLLLDLLCCIPALLVLLRRSFDLQYVVRWSWGHAVLGMLAAWLALSVLWASDQFAAMVESSHLIAALALVWAMSQLVRSWLRLRLVAGAALGLLLVLAAHGLNERLIDFPEQRRQWLDPSSPNSRWEYLRQRPELSESDFAFTQFEKKLLSGELRGFYRSPNSYAAVLVMLTMTAAGVAAQRLAGRDALPAVTPLVLALPAVAYALYHTHSRTGAVTLLLGLAALGLLSLSRLRTWLGEHARLAYGVGVGSFVLGAAAVVAHGIYHNSLFIQTLTFRWYYWRGSAAMVADHPVLGVGWANFGLYYPRYRLPLAVEEVKDPHNVFVRGFAELGVVGGVLFVAFALWIGWALTRPNTPPEQTTAATGRLRAVAWLIALPALAGVLHLIFAHDWNYPDANWLFLGAMASAGYTILLILGLALVALRGISPLRLDERPAPWLLYGTTIGLAAFFLHNLIDFALFEPGAMFIFAALAGGALGVRQPSVAGRLRRTWAAIGVFSAACLLWVIAFGTVWLRTMMAEAAAKRGDALVRQSARGQGGLDAGTLWAAFTQYELAMKRQPLNSDYAARAATASRLAGGTDLYTRGMIERAIGANPQEIKHRLQLARYLLERQPAEVEAVKRAYEDALALDPRSVTVHIEYAEALEKLGDRELALDQYRFALRLDDALPADEPRRLPARRRGEIEAKVAKNL